MKSNLPMPAVIGAIVFVVVVVGFFFARGVMAEPNTPRPNIYGGPAATQGQSYPGQGSGGATTPINPGGTK